MREVTDPEKSKPSGEGVPQNTKEDEQDPFLQAIKKYILKQEQIWPELIRLLILEKSKKPDSLPLEKEMKEICEKLSKCRPETFSVLFNFDEKVELFSHLIDMVHELDEFRVFLN